MGFKRSRVRISPARLHIFPLEKRLTSDFERSGGNRGLPFHCHKSREKQQVVRDTFSNRDQRGDGKRCPDIRILFLLHRLHRIHHYLDSRQDTAELSCCADVTGNAEQNLVLRFLNQSETDYFTGDLTLAQWVRDARSWAAGLLREEPETCAAMGRGFQSRGNRGDPQLISHGNCPPA